MYAIRQVRTEPTFVRDFFFLAFRFGIPCKTLKKAHPPRGRISEPVLSSEMKGGGETSTHNQNNSRFWKFLPSRYSQIYINRVALCCVFRTLLNSFCREIRSKGLCNLNKCFRFVTVIFTVIFADNTGKKRGVCILTAAFGPSGI